MKRLLTRHMAATAIVFLVLANAALAQRNAPVTGERLEFWVNHQQPEMQAKLMELFPESEGYFISGPLNDPALVDSPASLRVVSASIGNLANIIKGVRADSVVKEDFDGDHDGTWERPLVDRLSSGRVVTFTLRLKDQARIFVRFSSPQQERFAIWLAEQATPLTSDLEWYARAVSDHLLKVEKGLADATEPKASDFDIPDSLDFYAEPPDYVIEGYDNYLSFLDSYAYINTSIVGGVTEFVLSDSLLAALRAATPHEAYPNKEWPMLQREYRKFFERGGDPGVMQTLTRSGFDTLKTGEYFFAVGLTGRVRFGRELLRAEVERIEAETGHKVPRANHAFLFPGELILTAGAFFIEDGETGPHLAKVTAQSGHYFYSNVSETVREDIAIRSNRYLLTLGHFFVSLDSLEIPYEGVLISKF